MSKKRKMTDEEREAREDNRLAVEAALKQKYGKDAEYIILTRDDDPVPKQCQNNTTIFTRFAAKGELRYNAFTETAFIGDREVDDIDCVIIQETVERDRDDSIKLPWIHNAIELVADENQFHPVRDYLNALPAWDGVDRIGMLFIVGFGAEDSLYTREVGRMFLISAIARILKPGCKADSGPLLIGRTGVGKSTGPRVLFGETWVDDMDLAGNPKDMAMKLRGVWAVEFAELAGMAKADVEKIKSFISRTDDRQRDQWAKKVKSHPRQCVFFSSTNEDAPLRDNTGNRRFWPVHVEQVDFTWLAANREKLWAEALARYKRGEIWWDDGSIEGLNAVTVAQQLAATDSDVWEPIVLDYCEKKATVSLDEILSYLGHDVKDFDQLRKNRAAGILKKHGWTRRKRGNPRMWVYVNPREAELPEATVKSLRDRVVGRRSEPKRRDEHTERVDEDKKD